MVYVFPSLLNTSSITTCNATFSFSIHVYKLWYARLGHASSPIVNLVLRTCNISCKHNNDFCDACTIAKSHKLPFKDSTTVYHTPLQLVFMDIWDPSSMTASCGSWYYISFLYAYSRYT